MNLGECQVCRNRAEVQSIPDGRKVCGDCLKVLSGKLKKIHQEQRPPQVQEEQVTDERTGYLNFILENADQEWVKNFIIETVAGKILLYDWQNVIANERWFSVLDLKRFSCEIRESIEQVRPEPPVKQVSKNKAKENKNGA